MSDSTNMINDGVLRVSDVREQLCDLADAFIAVGNRDVANRLYKLGQQLHLARESIDTGHHQLTRQMLGDAMQSSRNLLDACLNADKIAGLNTD